MNPIVDKLLSQVYELEGLLLVINRHKGDVSPFIYEMIQKKAERIGELAPMFTAEAVEKWDKPTDYASPETKKEQGSTEEKTEVFNNNKAESFDNIQDVDKVKDAEIIDDLESFNNSTEQTTNEMDNVNPVTEEVSPPEYFDESSNDYIDETDDSKSDFFPDETIEEDNTDYDNLTLDDVLQRNLSKDLSKAFSLNDRFRYRRELFSNSEIEMRNTLNLVEAMHSFSEAEDYFYGDLEWDKESPEVADFMTIIKNHFL